MNRRSFLGRAATLASSLALPALAQPQDLNDAINKAGRQRMLSQRLAKAYLALGLDVASSMAHDVLANSMALFERQLGELKAYAPNADIKVTYQSLETAWAEFKAALTSTAPSRDHAPQVLALDARVLALAQQGTAQYEAASGMGTGRLVNLCGRQRMLSQRCAKLYLAQTWQVPLPQAQAELDKARNQFLAAHAVLSNAPEATPTIRDELELGRQQWVFFDNALQAQPQPGAALRHADDVFRASENILAVMDRVTGLYARLHA
jgi:hypothetical protein